MLAVNLNPTLLHATTGTGLLNGRSEELLGQFVREFPGSDKQRNSVCIATKLAPYPWRITSGIHSPQMHLSCCTDMHVFVLMLRLCPAVYASATVCFPTVVIIIAKVLQMAFSTADPPHLGLHQCLAQATQKINKRCSRLYM